MKSPPNALSLTGINRREFLPEARAFDTRAEGSGGISGTGNRVGEIDSYSTIVDPESPCFALDAIATFLKMGVFLANHSWSDPPIGYFNTAGLEGRDFKFDAEYHSTDCAQEMRAIADERKKAGKTVAFSLGFYVANYEWFENGKELVAALASRKRDLSLWNIEQISAYTDDVWIMQVSRIVEISQVNMASNEPSEADSVRGVDMGDGADETVFSVRVPNGKKFSPDEWLSQARAAGILDERTVAEIAAETDDGPPAETVDGTERMSLMDALIARDPFKPKRRIF